jgi:hypothetical protein
MSIPASCDDDFRFDKRIAMARYLIRCALREALHDQDDRELARISSEIMAAVIIDLMVERGVIIDDARAAVH